MGQVHILEVTEVGSLQPLGPGARNRIVVSPERFSGHSPFVLMVEDFIFGGHEYHMHPHRGIETVTFFLDGEMEHVDHLHTDGVVCAGDVQWMTAGRGIMHGGRPHGSHPVHALQLWLNLPARLKMSAPGTRIQRRAEARSQEAPGASVRYYGATDPADGTSRWSVWPMTLADVWLEQGATYDLTVKSGDRMFFYVLSGEIATGATRLRAGQTAWLDIATDGDRAVPLEAVGTATRMVAYAGVPIDEPVVAHGPFVMNTEAEIRQAYADLQSGRFLDPVGGHR